MRVKKINFKAWELKNFLQRLHAQRHRHLCWLQGEADWCRQQAVQRIQVAGWQQGFWVAASTEPLPLQAWGLPAGFHQLPAQTSRKLLGSEQPCLVVDAFTGFSPDALGALSGCVQAGGLLFLLTPDNWTSFDDPDYQRLAPWPWQAEQLPKRFLTRCQRLLENAEVLQAVQGQASIYPQLPSGSETALAPALASGAATQDQQRLVQALLKNWQLKPQLPQVVTANRGRGKSSALGLAAADWLYAHPEARLLVTAPTQLACQSLFQQFHARLKFLQAETLTGQLDFKAPDALLQEQPAADLLLVDEAAAIPVPLLAQLLAAYPRCTFATTQQGYEGNGRGFALRFFRHLDQQTPGWSHQQLQEPIRWAPEDPLEKQVNRLLLLDAEPPEPGQANDDYHFVWLDRDQLAQQEELLAQVFGLLVLAHYRTSPDDLRQLLDTPGVRLAAVFAGSKPLALAWIQEEGGMDKALAEEVFYGRRRPQGHLLAQSLCFHGGFPEAAQLRWWRLQRILVHPQAQRQGWGSRLLNWIATQARSKASEAPDFLGTSFGATAELLPFWQAAGYQSVRLGITRDPASGEHTLQLVQALSESAENLQRAMHERFLETLSDLLAGPLQRLPNEVIELLTRGEVQAVANQQTRKKALNSADKRELDAFAEGHRPWLLTLTALKKWLALCLEKPQIKETEFEVLAWQGLLYHQWSVSELVDYLGLPGKKHLGAWLRSSFKSLSSR
ncbi:tRNA(Met) cytidine acetyltransferase [Marinospirillum celere]|uniref:tRNA(Met) cytidine acetyltransferase TmcA n=1 Tax=Marinospirillum celere TaxID=1122252 RepID=A0A1I1JSS3_9GAMM|nr:GNAT family N-acetyltransferase [Marinospirillum celere]SFC51566.1 tRNA(Met) cytidine acetyltransferase [Marinospirillum celere]